MIDNPDYKEFITSIFGIKFPEFYAHNVFLFSFIIFRTIEILYLNRSFKEDSNFEKSSQVFHYNTYKNALIHEFIHLFAFSLWFTRLIVIGYFMPLIVFPFLYLLSIFILVNLSNKVIRTRYYSGH